VRVALEPGQLDDLDQEVANVKRWLDGGDPDDVIIAARMLMEEASLLLEFISDQTGWKRPYTKEDDDEGDADETRE
jgi:hypothetical protein